MPRNYKKKGYTQNQKDIAAFIVKGHGEMRTETQARCYATSAQSSVWYPFVRDLGVWAGGGVYVFTSTATPKDYTTSQGKLFKARRKDLVAHSRFCGITYVIKDKVIQGRSIAFLVSRKGSG